MAGRVPVCSRCDRRGRREPGLILEVEELQQVRLHGIPSRQVRVGADEAVLDEFKNCGMVHGRVRDIVLPREW